MTSHVYSFIVFSQQYSNIVFNPFLVIIFVLEALIAGFICALCSSATCVEQAAAGSPEVWRLPYLYVRKIIKISFLFYYENIYFKFIHKLGLPLIFLKL